MKHFRKTIGIIFVISIAIIIFGLTTGILWPSIYTSIYNKQLSLTPESTNYELWKETPIPMYLKIHMFNWTNPEEFSKTNENKPKFVEMGPYVFRQVDYKVNRVWNNNGTITFQRRRLWHFDESLSNGKLSDEVTNLNPVANSVAYSVRHKKKIARALIDKVMEVVGERLVTTKTVGELLFEGYNDTMLVLNRKLKLSQIPYTKFGWFYERNGSDTYDGTFNMLTGVDDMRELGLLKEWNYNSRSTIYPGECGSITGSNGELWPPLPDNKTVSIFISDICTTLKLTYDNTTIVDGITGSKYIADKTMLDNGTNVPSRSCYCTGVECQPTGTLNASLCKYDAPLFVSMPHFYLADPSYRENIEGMKPDKSKHQMAIALEPRTGVPLNVQAQLQLNMLVQPDDTMSLFKNIKKTFIPMLWFEQTATLTPEYASQVKLILILSSLGTVTCFGIASIGILILFIGIFICIRHKWQGEEGQVLLSGGSTYDVGGING